jgi:hypothetical protein
MIDRNECDLLMARHRRQIAQADTTGWLLPATRSRRTVREAIALALLALATRLAPPVESLCGAGTTVTTAPPS